MHRNVVPAALLFGNIILGLGCSDQKSEQLAQPIAPVLPPVKFEFTATANRVAADQVLINIVDSSDDGAKILTVGRPTIDQFHDVEGQPIRAKISGIHKVRKENFPPGMEGNFLVQILLRCRVPEEIGTLTGRFEALVGDSQDLNIDLSTAGSTSHPKLEALGIQMDAKAGTRISLKLKGIDVLRSHVVLEGEARKNRTGGMRASGGVAEYWWTLDSPPSDDLEIRYWEDESQSEQTPDLVVKANEPGPVSNTTLGISGELTHSVERSVEIIGPQDQLVFARLVDAEGKPINNRGKRTPIGPKHRWDFKDDGPGTALQVQICENSRRGTEEFNFENLKVNSQ